MVAACACDQVLTSTIGVRRKEANKAEYVQVNALNNAIPLCTSTEMHFLKVSLLLSIRKYQALFFVNMIPEH